MGSSHAHTLNGICLARLALLSYARLPDALVLDIEQEARSRRVSKSDVVRERLRQAKPSPTHGMRDLIGDLVGSVEGLPPKLSANKKKYLAELVKSQKTYRR